LKYILSDSFPVVCPPSCTDPEPCSDLNRMIMDYLVVEGYKSAAEELCQEANLTPPVDFSSIESRMDIRDALQRGDIEDAITRVNDLNPEVSCLSFHDHGESRRIKPFHAPL
jgi:hypothetical protein